MIKKKIKKYIALGLILASFLGIGGCSLNKAVTNHQEKREYTQSIIINKDKKTLEKQSVVENMTNIGKIEVLQVQVSKETKFKEGNFFKKEKDVKFYCNGTFKIDLSKITQDNVIINADGTITIFITEPELNVEFLEDMTEFKETKKGIFTFGDIELTTEEFEATKSQIKSDTYKDIIESEIVTAKEKVETVIENTLSTLTKSTYDIQVRWVK